MIKKLIIIIMGFSMSFYSCEKVKVEDSTIQVYKFDSIMDYSEYAPVELASDKAKITSSSSYLNYRWPVKLSLGFYLNGSMGVNSGYISLSKEEYNTLEIIPSRDSLYNLLITKEPYQEYYQRNDDGTFRNENGIYGIDTAKINRLIRTGKLGDYFEKLK